MAQIKLLVVNGLFFSASALISDDTEKLDMHDVKLLLDSRLNLLSIRHNISRFLKEQVALNLGTRWPFSERRLKHYATNCMSEGRILDFL